MVCCVYNYKIKDFMGLKHMVNYHPYPRSCTRQEPKMLSQKPLKKAEFSAVFPREVKIDFRTFKGRAHMMFSNSTKNPGEWQEWTNRLLPKLWCSLNSLLVLSVELPIPSAYWRKKKSITRRMSCEVSWIFVQNIQHKKKKNYWAWHQIWQCQREPRSST